MPPTKKKLVYKKRSHGESSGATFKTSHFKNESNVLAHTCFRRCGLNEAKPLPIAPLISTHIHNLFENTGLEFFVRISENFHSKLIYLFFANLSVAPDFTHLTSYIFGGDALLDLEDFASMLKIPVEGPKIFPHCIESSFDWTDVNMVLRNQSCQTHIQPVHGLIPDARIIQHILRATLIPKAGDKMNITQSLSLATYYVLTKTKFDVAHTILSILHNQTALGDKDTKKITNLSFGHIISYMLRLKYSVKLNQGPDHILKPFDNLKLLRVGQPSRKKSKAPASSTRDSDEDSDQDSAEGDSSLHLKLDSLSTEFHSFRTEVTKKLDDIFSLIQSGNRADDNDQES